MNENIIGELNQKIMALDQTINELRNQLGKIWNGKGYNNDGQQKFTIKDGKGKVYEYNSDGILQFEGEYINGLRNGKGKEYYDNGSIQFEGEYLHDKRWNAIGYDYKGNQVLLLINGKGKGKEYHISKDYFIYEGKYSNGKRNGNGKEYNESGKLLFEGEYLNGKWNGNVNEYDKNGELSFEGEYLIYLML